MSRKAFIELIEGFCALVHLDDPKPAIAGEPVVMNDVRFTFVQNDKVDPDLMFVYTEFGKIPPALEARVCKLLLEANLYLFIEKGPIFTLSPDQQSVVCADRLALGKATPQDVQAMLQRLSAKANEWRRSYFLDTKPPVPAQASKPGWLKDASI